MTINPIIPIWLMVIICAGLIALKRRRLSSYIRQIIMVILIFIINLRFMVPDDNIKTVTYKSDARVVFVVDNTISMLARDYDGKNERMEGVRKDVEEIMMALKGSSFVVLSFGNDARVACPATRDINHVKGILANMYPLEQNYAKGTSLNVVHKLLASTLKGASKNYVFFLSDGENTNGAELESFNDLAKSINGGAVLGYGTAAGGNMYVYSYFSEEEELVENRNDFTPAVSRIDEGNLKKLASDLNVKYLNRNKSESFSSILSHISSDIELEADDEETRPGMKDIYYWFVIPLALLLVYEYIDYRRKGRYSYGK